MSKLSSTLLAGAIGDILGSKTKNMTVDEISQKYTISTIETMTNKNYTCHTFLNLVLAQQLCENNDITSELLENLGKWQSNDYDDQLSSILIKKQEKIPIFSNNINTVEAITSTTSLGFLNQPDQELINKIGKYLLLTHVGNKDAIFSAFIHCKCINAIVNNKFKDSVTLFQSVLETSKINSTHFQKFNIIKYCLDSPEFSFYDIPYELSGEINKFPKKSEDCLVCAYYIFFYYLHMEQVKPELLEGKPPPIVALLRTISMGGNTTAITKIVGELCGAFYGDSWIPAKWRGIQDEDNILSLGQKLTHKLQSQSSSLSSKPVFSSQSSSLSSKPVFSSQSSSLSSKPVFSSQSSSSLPVSNTLFNFSSRLGQNPFNKK
jgi:ADP-ribosylglycohydrolase